jgi:hypothetical protein
MRIRNPGVDYKFSCEERMKADTKTKRNETGERGPPHGRKKREL